MGSTWKATTDRRVQVVINVCVCVRNSLTHEKQCYILHGLGTAASKQWKGGQCTTEVPVQAAHLQCSRLSVEEVGLSVAERNGSPKTHFSSLSPASSAIYGLERETEAH